MKKRKLRFNTEADIHAAINKVKAMIVSKTERAAQKDREADGVYAYLNDPKTEIDDVCRKKLKMEAETYREKAKKLRGQREGCETRIKKLGQKLAEFNTIPIPGVLPNYSVQAP